MYQKFIIGSVLMQLIDDYHEMERHFFRLSAQTASTIKPWLHLKLVCLPQGLTLFL